MDRRLAPSYSCKDESREFDTLTDTLTIEKNWILADALDVNLRKSLRKTTAWTRVDCRT